MRGLGPTGAISASTDLASLVQAVLDRRLSVVSRRPVAVALSGGGDSLALLLMSVDWARRVGREALVLSVDHGLQAQSPAWTKTCGDIAARLGCGFQALAWTDPKPTVGLPAAARAARHRLLACAARAAGARVLLMGHTADDGLEARAMRAAGSTTPEPREWGPSPAWPDGRDLFLLRPLIGLRRAALRDWLAARGEGWIDDPANDDMASVRARVRKAGVEDDRSSSGAEACALAGLCRTDAGGGLHIARADLRAAPPQEVRRFIALASVCAGGRARRPATVSLERVAKALIAGPPVTATLAGARITADFTSVLIAREPGETARGGLAPLRLTAGETAVWDGRFEVTAATGVEVRALGGLARRLPAQQVRALEALSPKVRAGLPAIVAGDQVTCPLLAPVAGVAIRALVRDRLIAAAGLVESEPA